MHGRNVYPSLSGRFITGHHNQWTVTVSTRLVPLSSGMVIDCRKVGRSHFTTLFLSGHTTNITAEIPTKFCSTIGLSTSNYSSWVARTMTKFAIYDCLIAIIYPQQRFELSGCSLVSVMIQKVVDCTGGLLSSQSKSAAGLLYPTAASPYFPGVPTTDQSSSSSALTCMKSMKFDYHIYTKSPHWKSRHIVHP